MANRSMCGRDMPGCPIVCASFVGKKSTGVRVAYHEKKSCIGEESKEILD